MRTVSRFALCILLTLLFGMTTQAQAQEAEPEIDMGEPEAAPTGELGTAADPSGEIDSAAAEPEAATPQPKAGGSAKEKEAAVGDARDSWKDIVVVIRKPFLKMNRVELAPYTGLTLNDNMIRHFALTAQASYWLTDVLAVGGEGQYFSKNTLETFDLVARQDRRLPTLNEYLYGGALNFHYVPMYAKFAMFKNIVHLEGMFTLGIGVTKSRVIPRDPANQSWDNTLITPNLGFSMRVFLTKFMTLNLSFRDYIFNDKYESVTRGEDPNETLEQAMAASNGQLVNHIMFQVGLSFWFPTSFRYTTFR